MGFFDNNMSERTVQRRVIDKLEKKGVDRKQRRVIELLFMPLFAGKREAKPDAVQAIAEGLPELNEMLRDDWRLSAQAVQVTQSILLDAAKIKVETPQAANEQLDADDNDQYFNDQDQAA